MKTELIKARHENGSANTASISRVAELLRATQVVAIPTDTVYGVAAVASQASAVAQLYVVKRRPPDKAIPVLLADAQDLDRVATGITAIVESLVMRFWPGGLTLILPKSATVPIEVSPLANVAVRVPDFEVTRQIIAAVGTPLAVTSANLSGEPTTRTAAEVLLQLRGRIAAVLDGGSCPGGLASTILDCTSDPPRVLRKGAVPIDALRDYEIIP